MLGATVLNFGQCNRVLEVVSMVYVHRLLSICTLRL
jgi:hypothetical protein